MSDLPFDCRLDGRLAGLRDSRWPQNGIYKLIDDFIVTPLLPKLITEFGRVHYTWISNNGAGYITSLQVWTEKDDKYGFWYNFRKAFCNEEEVIHIVLRGNLFTCDYYKYRYLETCDELKKQFDIKLKEPLNKEFVVVCRAK